MSKVHLLPEDVISKIAAGEVIERPASAVKELIENALDANTTSLKIHLKEAGKTLIHIKDTGSGIDKEDLENIFLRHATSKISSINDLDKIDSLGFRGEALYSIAAIADVTLKSKTPGQDSGWEIQMRSGKKISFKPAALPNGTELEIRELFFNTPARRKFLKSNTTELNQCLNVIIPYALFHYHCRFLVTHEGKTLLDLNPHATVTERMAAILNLNREDLIEKQYHAKESNIAIKAVLGNINIKRPQRDLQFIFINGRPVQNKGISFHLNQVYQLIFPKGHFPAFAVFIEMPPQDLDVNIHPTKREVKIKSEYQLTSILREMCEHALMTQGQAKQAISPQSSAISESVIQKAIKNDTEKTFETTPAPEFLEDTHAPASSEPYAYPHADAQAQIQEHLFSVEDQNLQSKLSRARFLGSFINKFLIFEFDKSLFVVDQHAAQERIAYEAFIRQMDKGKIEVQELLSPITLKLTPQEKVAFERSKDKLEELGLSSSFFDDETLAIHSYPILLKNPEPAMRHLLSGENISHCDHETIARRACRSSVMAGDFLNKEKAEYQRDQLIKCKDPFTCPHGRPTVIEMSEKFLDKQFLRT